MAGDAVKEKEYIEAISRVLAYIQSNLDEELTPKMLAREAYFSQHHFHRVFRAVVGESIMDHVRRLRLERAAYQLKADGGSSVARIALDAGYGAQEAFTRIFHAYFGMAPSEYRQSEISYRIPSLSGVHFGPGEYTPFRGVFDPSSFDEGHLCPIHRDRPEIFEERWEEIFAIITGYSSHVFCSTLKIKALEAQMTEATTTVDKEIEAIEHEIEAAKLRLIEARRRRPEETVGEYTFIDNEGRAVKLSELFGDKDDLIVVHNMGTQCSYCTMWADGFAGLSHHLTDRAAFVVCTPDPPEVQKRFAEKRNWTFRMISSESPFFKDMGFLNDKGEYWPGISSFRRKPDGSIVRVAKSYFDRGDDYCAVWPIFELLDGGPRDWEPKYDY
jgi:AraC-like DNA-binding protein/predicted dithiol-disulfide oxidoreductase (DUF899 family)